MLHPIAWLVKDTLTGSGVTFNLTVLSPNDDDVIVGLFSSYQGAQDWINARPNLNAPFEQEGYEIVPLYSATEYAQFADESNLAASV